MDGYNSVEVNVPKEHHNVTSKSITANGVYNSTGDEVWNRVDVNVPERQPVLESLSVTDNGTYTPSAGVDGYNSVEVNVPQSGGTGFDFNQLKGVSFKTNGTTIDFKGLDTSTFTNMENMFQSCRNLTSLDLSHFDTSKVVNMSIMFSNCQNLTSLDLSHFDTSKVGSMYSMFNNCSNLTSLDLSHFNTSNVTSMGRLFYNCQNLTSLNLSGWDTSKVTDMLRVFYNCTSLETIISDGLKLPNSDMSNIGLNNSTKLTVDSIVGLLNALPQTTYTYYLQIGTDNIAKLSDDQKAIATNKGWTLV